MSDPTWAVLIEYVESRQRMGLFASYGELYGYKAF